MASSQALPLPSLPGLQVGQPIRQAGGSQLFEMRDSATGAPRLVRLARPEQTSHEARILTRLAEVEGIAHLVCEASTADGRSALVTQFITGPTVQAALRHRALPWAPAVRATMALAGVLGAVHQCGIIHGAIRPEHVILASPSPVVIGFSSAVGTGTPHQADVHQAEWAAPETIGVALPASPEQDVYSLAAVLYALVMRRSPARAARAKAGAATISGPLSGPLTGPLPPVNAAGAPPALTAAIDYAVAADPSGRYRTMAEFSAALAAVLAGGEVPRPRRPVKPGTSDDAAGSSPGRVAAPPLEAGEVSGRVAVPDPPPRPVQPGPGAQPVPVQAEPAPTPGAAPRPAPVPGSQSEPVVQPGPGAASQLAPVQPAPGPVRPVPGPVLNLPGSPSASADVLPPVEPPPAVLHNPVVSTAMPSARPSVAPGPIPPQAGSVHAAPPSAPPGQVPNPPTPPSYAVTQSGGWPAAGPPSPPVLPSHQPGQRPSPAPSQATALPGYPAVLGATGYPPSGTPGYPPVPGAAEYPPPGVAGYPPPGGPGYPPAAMPPGAQFAQPGASQKSQRRAAQKAQRQAARAARRQASQMPPPPPPARPPANQRPAPTNQPPVRPQTSQVAPATGPNASLDQDQLEERRSRAAHPLAIFAATLLVVAVALGIWWFGRTTPDPTTSPQWPSQSDPTIVEVNDPLPELEAAPVTDNSQGDPVFAWDNPAPQAGDQYHWWLLSHQDQSQVVLQTHVGVARPDFGTGPVCIEVQLVRAERASQQVLRLCEE